MIEKVRSDRETDEDHDKDSDEEGLQLPRAKLDRGGERGRQGIGVGWCTVFIRDGAE